MASGMAAANTVKAAKENGDFSEKQLASYKKALEENFVLKDLKTFRHAPKFLGNPNIYDLYPGLACGVVGGIYRVDGKPRKKIMQILKTQMKGKVSMWRLISDVIQGGRAVIWK